MDITSNNDEKQSSTNGGGLRRKTTEATSKIIGGNPVDAGEYPWFVRAILKADVPDVGSVSTWYGCGASLVTPEFALTAAHCVFDTSLPFLGVQVGALCEPFKDGDNCGQDIEEFDVVEVFNHPGYSAFTSDKDFALLKLSGMSTIPPVPMDTDDVSLTYVSGKPLWPIGLGTTVSGASDDGVLPDRVLDVQTKYVPNSTCRNKYFPLRITPAMMCSGDLTNGGEDACQGDSGGPLYDKENDVLVGISSWGIGCGLTEFPGVYSRISNQFDEWIKPTICDNHSDPKPEFCGGGPPPPPPPPPSPPCTGDEDIFKVELFTDGSGEDITWGVLREVPGGDFEGYFGNGSRLGSPYGDDTLYTEDYCIPPGECYEFRIFDEEGDGLKGSAGYRISLNDEVLEASRFRNKKIEKVQFGC